MGDVGAEFSYQSARQLFRGSLTLEVVSVFWEQLSVAVFISRLHRQLNTEFSKPPRLAWEGEEFRVGWSLLVGELFSGSVLKLDVDTVVRVPRTCPAVTHYVVVSRPAPAQA